MAYVVLFEIFRKLKFWYPAHCLADVKIDNGSFMEIDQCTLLKLKTNAAMTLFYIQEYGKALTCCQHMIDNYGDSKVLTDFFPMVTLIAASFIMQNKLDEALHCMESNMKLLADNVITGEHTKHAVFLLNMSVIYFLKGHCEEFVSLAKKAKNIVVANLGIFHYLHGVLPLQISFALEQTQS